MSITADRPTTTTTAPAPTPTPTAEGPDLTLFLLAHRVFRHEFARLAKAAENAPDPKVDMDRKDAIDKQIAMMMRSLHAHHTGEDTRLWPLLRERDPAAAVVLDRLEREHQHIDPLIAAASDRTVLLQDRAPYLAELASALSVHLDHEEADAVPLLRRHLTRAEWEADSKTHLKEVRRDTAMFVGTMTDFMSEDEVADLMANAPKALVVLYKLSWRRRWAKRRALVHGS